MKTLAGILFACGLICLVVAGRGVMREREASVSGSTVKVWIELEDGKRAHGSAVHLGNGTYLTAGHVAEEGELTIENDHGEKAPARTLWINKDYDVAMIDSNMSVRSSWLSCRDGQPEEQITATGNPHDLNFVTVHGRILKHVGKFAFWDDVTVADMLIGGGMSGGPVFNSDGRVIGTVVGGPNVNLMLRADLIFVPASAVCKLTGRV